MIRHIVLFTLHEDISPDDDRVRKAFAELEGLKERIDLIRGWEVGRNFSDRPIAVDFALDSTFDSKEDLSAYIGHEAHQSVVALLKKISTWVLCDYVV